jgi:hypothetical protein
LSDGSTRKRLKLIATLLLMFAFLSLAVIVVNQTFQLVMLAGRFGPAVSQVVFWSLMALYGICLGVPIFMIATLPKALRPPESSEGPEFEAHVARLRKRLGRNPHVEGKPTSLDEIESALLRLDVLADAKTKAAASQVFISTAISQNGSLDGVLVLAAQAKLVLEIARVYYQRPAFGDLLYLYTNVAATAFVAAELEDVDLSEQVQPVLTAVLGSTAGAIPGLGAAATLFANSVTTGAGNAFLTLRVGLITKQYCRALVLPARKGLRHSAAIQALALLGGIAREGAAHVAAAIWSRPRQYFSDLIEGAGDRISNVSNAMITKSAEAWNAAKRPLFQKKGEQGELSE